MRPKFRYSDLKNLPVTEKDPSVWEKDNELKKVWVTPERIPIKSVYSKEELAGMEHLNYDAGLPPFLHYHIQVCMQCCPGPSDNTQDSPQLKNQMHFTGAILPHGRRGYQQRSTFLLTGDPIRF